MKFNRTWHTGKKANFARAARGNWLLVSFAFIILFIGGLFVAGYIYCYMIHLQYQGDISAIIRESAASYKNLPRNAESLPLLSEGRHQLSVYVARQLIDELDDKGSSMIGWHFQLAMWSLMISNHFNDDEIGAIWFHYMPYEKGVGLNDAAMYKYGMPADKIGIQRIAELVVSAKAPYYYSNNPKILREKTQRLVKRLELVPR